MRTFTDDVEYAHQVLGLGVFAEPDQIRRAFRRKARLTHPDAGGDDESFGEVQRAAELLLTPDVRAYYESEKRLVAERMVRKSNPVRTANKPAPSTLATVKRVCAPRHSGFLVAAAFGCLFAPHASQIGLTWEPAPLHFFYEFMQSLDWVFFAAWLWVKKSTTVRWKDILSRRSRHTGKEVRSQ